MMYLTSKLNIISLFLGKRKNIANWTFGEDGEGPWQQMLKLSILDSTKNTINAKVLENVLEAPSMHKFL